jgi:recombination protein RecT
MWNKWEKAAWLKTVARELEKWVPSSSEFRREQLRAAVEADNLRSPQPGVVRDIATGQGYDPGTGEIVDGEVVDADAEAAAQAAAESRADEPAEGGEGA